MSERTSFSVGDVVRAHGLQNARELNGMVGVVFRQRKSGAVLAVQLFMRPKKLELQAKNLQHVDISGWGLPSNQFRAPGGNGAAVGPARHGVDPAQIDSRIAPITALPMATVSEGLALPSPGLDQRKEQSQSSEDIIAAVMGASTHRSPSAATTTTTTTSANASATLSSPDLTEMGRETGTKTRATKSLFSEPAVQATLGGPQRAIQTRMHFEQPLQVAPRDPRANLAYAKLILSVCVGVRASGVFVAVYPEYEKAKSAFQVAVDPGNAGGADFSARERSEALISYGLLLQSGGELEKCLQCLESACDADSSNPAVSWPHNFFNLFMLYTIGV